jgi:hypothetical protein
MGNPDLPKSKMNGALHMKHSSESIITNSINEYIDWLGHPATWPGNCAFRNTFHQHVNNLFIYADAPNLFTCLRL